MLTVATHDDLGQPLATSAARETYTQYLLSAIFIHGYRVCEPVDATVLLMADGTYQCLDMPTENDGAFDPPDGGVDLFDYIHFLKVRSGKAIASQDVCVTGTAAPASPRALAAPIYSCLLCLLCLLVVLGRVLLSSSTLGRSSSQQPRPRLLHFLWSLC